jgi:SAM-dependent methyltransferase
VINGKVVIGYGINDVDYGFSAHSLTEYMGNEMAEIFGEIYEKNVWGGKGAPEFYSGRGSNDDNTTEYRQYVQCFIMENNVTNVVDIGCGDFRVGRLMDWDGVTYVGVDVVGELIERNNRLYASQNVTFLERDVVSESLPSADLCLMRQVFQHLSNRDIMAVLSKLRKYKFVLITDGLPIEIPVIKNADKPTDYNNRFNELYGSGLYLELPPFNLCAEVVLSYLSRNEKEIFRTLLIRNGL